MRYFIGDCHFHHELIRQLHRSEFATVEEMNDYLINCINKTVKRKDKLFILGDFSFGNVKKSKEILDRINCKNVVLIRGNHDYKWNIRELLYMGFKNVDDYDSIEIEGTKVLMSHYPYHKFFKSLWYYFTKLGKEVMYYNLSLPYRGYFLLHGHHHKTPSNYKEINVAWDINKKVLSEIDISGIIKNNKTSLWKDLKFIFR